MCASLCSSATCFENSSNWEFCCRRNDHLRNSASNWKERYLVYFAGMYLGGLPTLDLISIVVVSPLAAGGFILFFDIAGRVRGWRGGYQWLDRSFLVLGSKILGVVPVAENDKENGVISDWVEIFSISFA